MRRLDKGAPLRAAMKAAELDIPRLAAKTREIDPEGKGISKSLVGFIVGSGRKTAREECSDRAAELISAVLGQEVTDFFEPVVFTLGESTSTRKSWTGEGRRPLPAQLMDQRALAEFLRKSPSWIDSQIADAKERGELWPGLIYVGRSRRFDPHAVLDAMRKQRTAA